MKVAIWHNLPSGGGKRALYDHVKGLVERGHHVEAWCPSTADSSYLPLSDLVFEHVLPLEIEHQSMHFSGPKSGIRSCRLMKRRLAAMDRHCATVGAQVNTGEFDVLFANACTFFRAAPIAKHVALPSVLYLQEPYRWLYEALPKSSWPALPPPSGSCWSSSYLRRYAGNLLGTQSLRIQMREEIANAAKFDKILVNSLYSRESVLRAYGLESEVCYLGVDLGRFKPLGGPKGDFVIAVGGLYYAKGPDRTIEALGMIPWEKRPPLVWVGNFADATSQSDMEALARARGVDLTIKVRVNDKELQSLLSRAVMMIYTPRLEPFGLAPLEANACGTAVVAVAEGGIRETVFEGTNGLLARDARPAAIARVISRLLADPALADELGKRAVSYVRERWSLTEAVDRLESILEATIEEDSEGGVLAQSECLFLAQNSEDGPKV